MATIKCLTIDELKSIEKELYNRMNSFIDVKNDYLHENNKEMVKSYEEAIKYERGKWAIIYDLVKKLEGDK